MAPEQSGKASISDLWPIVEPPTKLLAATRRHTRLGKVSVALGLAARLKLAKLMMITSARSATGDLAALVGAAYRGGVDIVQLRQPGEDASVLVAAMETIEQAAGRRGLASAYGSTEVAEKAQANVLQLSAMDGSVEQLQAHLNPWVLVGRSCHSAAQVDAALADPQIAFFTVSPVFNAGGVGEAGLGLVRHAAERAPLSAASKPWFAVGGVNGTNLEQVLAAGARRIGVTRAVIDAENPLAAAAALKERLTEAWNADPGAEGLVLDSLGS